MSSAGAAGLRLPPLPQLPAAVVAQWRLLLAAVQELPADAFDRPTRLPGWRVAELVAHLGSGVAAVRRYLAEPPPRGPVLDLAGYLAGCAAAAGGVAARARAAAAVGAAELPGVFRRAVDEAAGDLAAVPATRVLASRFGAIRLPEFLATRCVEATVHALDLAAAVGAPPALHDLAVGVAGRALASALVVAAPGRAVELRVPGAGGFAAQCAPGPRHTRGTPGSVVETDPVSWLELASGRLRWADAVGSGRVRAGGSRADLSAWLPVLR